MTPVSSVPAAQVTWTFAVEPRVPGPASSAAGAVTVGGVESGVASSSMMVPRPVPSAMRCVDGTREVDREGLVGLVERVAHDRHGDGPRGLARGEGEVAARGGVVGGRAGAAVGGGVVDGHGLAAGGAEADREGGADGTRVALGDADVVDRECGRGVVVDDGAEAGAIGERCVDGTREADREGLVGLVERVAHDRHGDGPAVWPAAKVRSPLVAV